MNVRRRIVLVTGVAPGAHACVEEDTMAAEEVATEVPVDDVKTTVLVCD